MTRARKAAAPAEAWFAQRGWKPFAFQRDVWAAIADGRSGLLHASTGSGKTHAVWWGALLRGLALTATRTGTPPRPDWAGVVALHHGSLDKSVREWVEDGLKQGRLKAVVATSSLDLGVDFLPVERVLQIGSA